jgi:hypothetical protein
MSYGRNHRFEELREELRKLMGQHLEYLNAQTFGGLTEGELRKKEEILGRIREVAAELLLTLNSNFSLTSFPFSIYRIVHLSPIQMIVPFSVGAGSGYI